MAHADLGSGALAQAVLWACGDQDGAAAILGVDDLHIHQAGAQAQILQVVSDDGGQVLVVRAIAVPVQIGAVLAADAIRQGVLLQLIWHPALIGSRSPLHHAL